MAPDGLAPSQPKRGGGMEIFTVVLQVGQQMAVFLKLLSGVQRHLYLFSSGPSGAGRPISTLR